jgi:hypothetical protein
MKSLLTPAMGMSLAKDGTELTVVNLTRTYREGRCPLQPPPYRLPDDVRSA